MQRAGESSYEARIVQAIMELVIAEEHRDEETMTRCLVRAVLAAKALRKERRDQDSGETARDSRIEYDKETP